MASPFDGLRPFECMRRLNGYVVSMGYARLNACGVYMPDGVYMADAV